MRVISRTLALLSMVVIAAAANANIIYNVITAKVSFSGGPNNGITDNLLWDVNSGTLKIDFFANNYPIAVQQGESATVEIIYEAWSDVPVDHLQLIFQGWAFNASIIGYSEFIEDMGSENLGQVVGVMKGEVLGGSDQPFTVSDSVQFTHAVNHYKVKKTFSLSAFENDNEIPSFASIGVIEQNANPVPEPATLGALGIGALGLLARRRRNK